MSLAATRERLRAIENKDIPGLTRPQRARYVTGVSLDPFNNNAAHAAKRHGISIPHVNDLMMPLKFENNIGNTEAWAHATIDKKIQMAEEDWQTKTLAIPEYKPEPFDCDFEGYMQIDIAPQLLGRRWDSITRAYLQAFRPSQVVLLDHDTDPPFEAMWWRIIVRMNEMGRLVKITQDVKVPLPRGVTCGGDLKAKADNKM